MDDVDKIKSKLDIVELIGEHLQLKKAGRNFKAVCPFHNEKSASFVVSPERQIWHCFGCSKGGDIFTFFTEYENITFSEALKELALRAGVKLVLPAARSEKEKKQELIYSLNHLASQFYNFLLLEHPAGKMALEYLTKKRKIPVPLIKTFNLGFAPANNSLTKYLISKKHYKANDLLEAGLAFIKNGQVSDFFKNRIIFPICDPRGNVVAFSGRGLDDQILPKYVNTRETPVYIKGDTLFGLNLAKDAIKAEGKAVIVEGEFDVITAHKEGISNIVAVKGTALTENQIKLLKRFTERFGFCFDTDPAGTEAQRRSIQMIDREGLTATVIVPPQGKDPDELLNENPALFKKVLKNDVNVYDFIIDSALKQYDSATSEGKKNILQKTLPFISPIENEVIKEHFLKKLADKINTSFDAISKQAEKTKSPQREAPIAVSKIQVPPDEARERYLLSLILQSQKPKETLAWVKLILSDISFLTPSYEKILSFLLNFEQKGVEFSIRDFTNFLPAELHAPLDTAYLAPITEFGDESQFKHEVEKISQQVKIATVKKGLSKLSEYIKTAETEKNEEKLKNYQERFDKLSKLLSVS